MNELGQIAMTHWMTWLPDQYRQIPDPETHFRALGEDAQDRQTSLEEEILQQTPPSPDYLAEMARRHTARQTAREMVLAEILPTPPEAPETAGQAQSEAIDPTGMPMDHTHPLWADLEDETISAAEFQARRRAWIASLPTP